MLSGVHCKVLFVPFEVLKHLDVIQSVRLNKHMPLQCTSMTRVSHTIAAHSMQDTLSL